MGEEEKKRIVTGQQIGLLGGPLYTAYKVLGAIRWAEELRGEAVYWLETNDADFNEINRIDYLDGEDRLRTLRWDIDSRGYSCGEIEIDSSLPSLLEQFFSTLRRTEFTSPLGEMVLDSYRPGRTLGEASAALASKLFSPWRLTLFDPSVPEFREFSRPILMKEAENTPDGGQCNLFCLRGKRREAVFKRGEGYCLRDGTVVDLNRHELVPNVRTRSVCQDAYFHTHTYIAGPGEVEYLEEMDTQFRFHGVKRAAVKPRMSVTLTEPRVRRLLQKTGLSPGEVLESNKDDLLKRVLKETAGFDFSRLVEEAEGAGREYLDRLGELGMETGKFQRLVSKEVKRMCGERRAREKAKNRELIRRVQYLSDSLRPYGKKQERVFNVFYFMNLYGGTGFLRWLYEHYDFAATILEVKND